MVGLINHDICFGLEKRKNSFQLLTRICYEPRSMRASIQYANNLGWYMQQRGYVYQMRRCKFVSDSMDINNVWIMSGFRGGDRGSGHPPPLKNHKNIGFSSKTGPDPLKNRSYQASIQCWVIIGTPAKRHLMAFCWRADDGPLIAVLESSLPSSTKKKKKTLSKLDPL